MRNAMTSRTTPLLLALALALVAGCQHAAPADAPSSSQVLLLGEVHDNMAGHTARAAMLRTRIEAGWRPVIAMEQFDTGQQATLDAAMRDCADAECVVAKVAPAKSGWTWAYYTPVIALAMEYKLPLRAANLSRGDASKIVKGGFAAGLSPDGRALPAAEPPGHGFAIALGTEMAHVGVRSRQVGIARVEYQRHADRAPRGAGKFRSRCRGRRRQLRAGDV